MKPVISIISHPVSLVIIVITSVILWMPFGVGYYGFPWEDVGCRIALETSCIMFLAISFVAFLREVSTVNSGLRVILPILSLLTSAFGLLAFYSWKESHLDHLRAINIEVSKWKEKDDGYTKKTTRELAMFGSSY